MGVAVVENPNLPLRLAPISEIQGVVDHVARAASPFVVSVPLLSLSDPVAVFIITLFLPSDLTIVSPSTTPHRGGSKGSAYVAICFGTELDTYLKGYNVWTGRSRQTT